MISLVRFGLLLIAFFGVQHVYGQAITVEGSTQTTTTVPTPKRIEAYYDSDQKLLKEVFYVADTIHMLLEGPYTAYYASGSLKEKGQYANNIATGLWEYYYESGTPKMSGQLKDGANWGHWKYYFESGKLSMEGAIYDGKRQEEWIHYYENGSIKRRGKYLDNKKVGIWNYFYESQEGLYGPLKAQAFYENGTGSYKEFYPNSGVKAEGLYEDGKSEGLWTFYHPNGKPQARGQYVDGVRTGKWEYFHEDGYLTASGTFEEGLRQGRWEFFNPNGTLSSEGVMQEDEKEGYWKLYNLSGEFRGEGNFVKGEGEFKEFYESGRLKATGTIRNDKNEGEWLYYYEDGRLEGKAAFSNGKGYYRGFYPDGTLNMEGEVENGQRVGVWKMYKPSGELSGFYKVYYENDAPVYKIVEDTPQQSRDVADLPEYRYRVRTFRNFKPQINEFKALILATNPLAMPFGSLPVSIEYYVQERLGYDLIFTFIRTPFFEQHTTLPPDEEYAQGFSFALRQKFYQKEDKLGMFYYGHELRVSPISHYMNMLQSDGTLGADPLQLDELKLEYSVLFGNRLTRDAARKGLTVDVFLGLGVGYRFINEHFPETEPTYKGYFDRLRDNRLTIPIRIGVNFGYALNRLKRY